MKHEQFERAEQIKNQLKFLDRQRQMWLNVKSFNITMQTKVDNCNGSYQADNVLLDEQLIRNHALSNINQAIETLGIEFDNL